MENLRTSTLAARKKTILVLCFIIFSILTAYSFAQPSITWQRMYKGPIINNNDLSADICETADGNFFVAGYTESHLYVLKLNGFGDSIITKYYNNLGVPNSIISSDNGGCIIAGRDYIVKLDSICNIVWDIDSLGRCNDVIRTSSNEIIACGNINFIYGYCIKLDQNGNVIFQRTYASGYSNYYSSIIKANNGGYILAGSSTEYQTDTSKALLTHINENGDIVWEKKFKIMNRLAGIKSIVNLSNGYAVSGTTADSLYTPTLRNAFMGRVDNNGNLLYSKILFADRFEVVNSMVKTNENNFIFSIYRGFLLTSDSIYAKMLITDSLGFIKKQKDIASKDNIVFYSVLTVTNGDIMFTGNADFNPSGGNEDIYIIRSDSMLNFPPNIISIQQNQNIYPKEFILEQNYPNPFNPSTKIRFDLPANSNTNASLKLTVFDITGKEVKELLNTAYVSGKWEIDFDASSLAAGTYFYKIQAGDYTAVNKMILVK